MVTQFQGAFSDNVLKNLVVFMMIGANVPLTEEHRTGELVTALFSLPFILFSMLYIFLAVTVAYLLWRQVMKSPAIEEVAALAAAGR